MVGLAVIVGGYFLVTNPTLASWVLEQFTTQSMEVEVVVEEYLPQTVPAPGFETLDDDVIREALPRFKQLGLPAQARVSRLDDSGAWSSIFLGPFESQADLVKAKKIFEDNFSPWYSSEASEVSSDSKDSKEEGSKPSPSPQADKKSAGRPQVLVEFSELIADEDIYAQLDKPIQAGMYAFVRTAVVVEGSNGELEPRSRIYLGPFATEEEALDAVGRLAQWPIATDYTVSDLSSSPKL